MHSTYALLFLRLWLLRTIERSWLTSLINTLTVEDSSKDMIPDSWKILHTTTTDHDDRVLLKVVSFTSDVGDDFISIRETNLCYLAECWVRLLRSTRIHLETYSSTLRCCERTHRLFQTISVELKCWWFTFSVRIFSFAANELVDSRHEREIIDCRIWIIDSRCFHFWNLSSHIWNLKYINALTTMDPCEPYADLASFVPLFVHHEWGVRHLWGPYGDSHRWWRGLEQ